MRHITDTPAAFCPYCATTRREHAWTLTPIKGCVAHYPIFTYQQSPHPEAPA